MSNTVTPVAKLSNANKFLSKPYDKEMRQRLVLFNALTLHHVVSMILCELVLEEKEYLL
jgi:hypothetical protein